ncbi:histidine kinase [Pseudomonas taeanensis MS-3]|uniref:histidine kinase n=1 Tax=Pseudomonas taeanensis MS-3 TaxID=1395571 RepID=A0A0A1YIW1_9PSED|nr:PAS domain S-box protein [Pseudomonas taeanensis]KFX69011.1 histidine kinase [Pseudomonas taeanensis MS-3]
MSQPMPILAAPQSAAEHQLRQIVDNSSAVIYVKDLDGRLRLVNRTFEQLFQLRSERVLGRTDHELFPQEMADVLRANDQRVARSGEAMEFEECVLLGKESRTYLSSKFPLFDDAGRVTAVCGISTDISSRKNLEDALRHVALGVSAATSGEVFEAIARYMTRSLGADFAFVSRINADGRSLTTLALYYGGKLHSNATYQIMGTACEEVLGKAFHFVPSGLGRRYPSDQTLMAFGVDSYAGYPLFSSDGRPLGLIAAGRCGPLEEPDRIESVLRIFSVRAAAEIERLEAEASYRAIFDSSEDAIFVHDLDSRALVDVNPKACQSYGYSHAEMLKLNLDDFSAGYTPYTGKEAAGYLARAKAGETQRFEWHRRNRDGSLHWDEVLLKRATIGGVDRILAFAREITQRKEAEQALRNSEMQYRAITNTALDCFIGMDERGRVLAFNPAAEQCFGMTREEVLGRLFLELFIPERFRVSYERGIEHYLETGQGSFLGKRMEVVAQRATGEEFPAELALTVVQGDEGPRFICYLRDITERKQAETERVRLEQQLRQAQRMEAIGHLTGGIAHDFNNLLTSMLGYTVMAQELAEQLHDERLDKYLARVQRSAEKARDLIQQMLTFSRGSRGKPQAVALDLLLGDFIKLVESTLPASVELETELTHGLPQVLVDPVQLEQVLMNLCINARDAMGSAGRLRVSLGLEDRQVDACASCQQPVQGSFVALTVSDSGPGIAAGVRAHMFEPFFSTKPSGQGSGMGLSMVHGIVHEYGGHIQLETAPGLGTTFRILIPALSGLSSGEAKLPVSKLQPLPRSALQGRVVVVDDDQQVAEFMVELLEGWGLSVQAFCDAEQASALLVADPYAWDFVILDQSMPRLSGLQLARRVLAARADLPIVLYTGFSDALVEAEVMAQGLKALLSKPLDQSRLHALLCSHLLTSLTG